MEIATCKICGREHKSLTEEVLLHESDSARILDLDWSKAYERLQEVRKRYVEIGASGVPGLTITLNPLVVRYARGERTLELYNEMRSVE